MTEMECKLPRIRFSERLDEFDADQVNVSSLMLATNACLDGRHARWY
jgi:hypothetical protein